MANGEEGGGRVLFLDALRGVAILGILPVNAAFFAYPVYLAMEPGYPDPSSAASAASARAVEAIVEGKFHTIFALLFGAGMAILRSRTAERGGRWAPLVVRRLLVLWLLGCAHGVLVWYGDIVAYYALFGLALAWTPGRSPRLLRTWGVALLALPLPLFAAALAGLLAGTGWIAEIAAEMTSTPMPDGRIPHWSPGSWAGFGEDLFRFDADFEVAVYREGTFGQVTALRATTWALASLGVVPLWGPRIAGLLLIGMAWAGEGWFLAPSSEEGRRRFGRMLRWGLLVGVPLTAGGTLLSGIRPDDPAAAVAAETAHYVGSLGMAAAYAALVAKAVVARPGAAWVRAAAAVGRMAFTNYLVQSIAMTFLFYGTTILFGRGLGLFGGVGRLEVLGIAAGLGAVQVLASVLWLRSFRMGPVEWAWRAATYLRVPPLRRGTGPPTARVRDYVDADFEDVVALWHRSKRAAYPFLPQEQARTLQEDREFFRANLVPRCRLRVCEEGGVVRAFLAMRGSYLDRLYVDPGHQRRGIGRLLMDEAFRASPAGIELHTHVENRAARAFYEGLGFRAFAFGVSPPPESAPDVEYRWRPDGSDYPARKG